MQKVNKALYIRIFYIAVVILFIVLVLIDRETKAAALLFISGGALGLITKTIPFILPSKNPYVKHKITYNDDSILGPFANILAIFLGLIALTI